MIRSRVSLVIVLLLALALPGSQAARLWLLDQRADPAGKPVVVEVPKGAGVWQVADILAQAGVIRHPWAFAAATRLMPAGPLKAGEYALSPAMSHRGLIEHLGRGRVLLHDVTVPEGYTLAQIIDRLADLRLVEREAAQDLARDPEFIASLGLKGQSLEGYLFPDTYRFPRGLGARAVLGAMARRFLAEWQPLAGEARRLGLGMIQAVTLASIIEREARVAAERPLVSAVYHNRLKQGMKLQADPTVIYGLKDVSGGPTRAHLERDHPYNTYTREGLPPGPICSPGLASLVAAVRPAPVDYVYFVAKGDGSHAFSRDYRDQVNNVNRYQKRPNQD
ncbi:MAG: endolytic transglycosylase MltG [Thermodesulfobacteriota bacterium]